MAKGVHSKRRKFNMSVKRKVMEEKVFGPRQEATSNRLFARTYGAGDDSVITRKKNAFRYPNNPEAEFPQAEKPVYIEKRARYLPTEYLIKNTGEKTKNRIKREQQEYLQQQLAIAEGKFNEGKPIDLDKMDGIIDNLEMININDYVDANPDKSKRKTKKEKDFGMEIDDIISNPRHRKRAQRKGYKHQQKSKKHMKF